jgi:hypothetical protein
MDNVMLEFYKSALSGDISSPLCSGYKAEWRKCGNNKEKLVRMSLSQQAIPYVSTYANKHNGLTKDYIKHNFGDYINGAVLDDCDGVLGYTYGLYVDWDYEKDLVVDKDVSSLMWCVGTNVVIPTSKCPTIYISNRSNVHLVCEGFNSVHIKLFDKSKVTIEDMDEESDVTVFRYSDECVVETGKYCLKEPKVFNKELRL